MKRKESFCVVFDMKTKQNLDQLIVYINNRIGGFNDIIYGILIGTETHEVLRLQRLKQKIKSIELKSIQLFYVIYFECYALPLHVEIIL